MMKLYLIVATSNGDGANLDLMVWAHSKLQALTLWRLWATKTMGLQRADLPTKPRVFNVPFDPPTHARVLNWHDDVKEV